MRIWTVALSTMIFTKVWAGSFLIHPPHVTQPPRIDGIIEDVWYGSAIATDFIQYEPNRGERSKYSTTAMLCYDTTNIYIAFSLLDTDVPTAQLNRRDGDLLTDDAVIVILDTYHDHRTAYYFMINPLGTQTDGRIVDDGRTTDVTWDASWHSAAQRMENGWSAEFAIPFSSLKYAAGDSVTWGINLGRSRRRNLETSFWAGPLESLFRVSQAGMMTGLMITPPIDRLQVIPYILGRHQDNKFDWPDVGVDVRYSITPKISAYATINPDFATIEADQEQVNLSRFELSLPEKRQFFIEGNEMFKQRIATFYSRRIPDIAAGSKILGKQGPWALAAIAARSEAKGDHEASTYTIARAQRDVSSSSTVAFMVADRSHSGKQEGSTSADATLFFSKSLGMTTQVVKSYGDFHEGTWAFFIRPAYDSPTAHFHIRYSHLGERVSENINRIGFISDDNRRELDSAFEKTLWFKRGLMERLGYSSNYNMYRGQNNRLRSWQIDQSMEIELRNRFACELDFSREFKRFEKDYQNWQTGLALGYNTREFQSAKVGYEFGRNFDADFGLWQAGAGYKLTSSFALEYELERLILIPDPEAESTWIHVLKANQYFTKDIYLCLFFQTNSSIDRKNVHAVFVYRFQPPFGTMQLAYQRGTAGFGQRSDQGDTFFLKIAYVL